MPRLKWDRARLDWVWSTGARRRPTTCCSPNHPKGSCWGYVRKCPCCGTRVCYEDGAADDLDAAMPGICDTCAMGAEPRVVVVTPT